MPFEDLSLGVLQQVRAVAVQHARPPAVHRRCMSVLNLETVSSRFDAVDRYALVVEERMEKSDGVRAAADAGNERVRQPPLTLHHLLARLRADDRLEIAHHGRIGMWAGRRADEVVGVAHVGHPIAQGFVHCVLECAGAGRDGIDLGAEHMHARHVRRLPRHVGRTHVDLARKAETRAHRRHGNAMLPGAGLGDDARLLHAPRQLDLAQAVVDLMAARVVELVALEVDFGAALAALGLRHLAEMRRQPLGVVKRARPSAVVEHEVGQLGLERRIVLGGVIGRLQIEDQRHQRFGNEPPAVEAEVSPLVGTGLQRVELGFA